MNLISFFNFLMDILKSVIDQLSLALIISCISLFMTGKLWLKTNKPIVTAIINLNFPDNPSPSSPLKLIIYNSGNRPATNIKLKVNPRIWFKVRFPIMSVDHEIKSIFNEKASIKDIDFIKKIFSKEVEIPVLINGKDIETAFGSFNYIKVGSQLPIIIEYSDLDNKKHKSKLTLLMLDPKGFGGGIWQ